MVKKGDLTKQLEGFRKDISKEYPIKKMILFGSRASGKITRHSDIDLILVSPKFRGRKRLDRSPPLYLKWDLHYPVDLICLTPEEFSRKKKQIGIIKQAVEEGIEIRKI
jgi:uncharacterized protein